MDLHRTSAKPDWELIPGSERTAVQRLAAATNGYFTPANLITIVGLGIVIAGSIVLLYELYWLGLALLAIGRLLDIADGLIADKTGTKSPLGEIFDAAADKFGTLITIVAIILANITLPWIIIALIIPQIIIPIVIFYKKRKGIDVHPTLAGKLSMGLTWAGIIGLLVTKALGQPIIVTTGIYVIIGISLALGLIALWQYSTGRD
jgi:phosphatidylglycerophosphate synthase